MFLKCMTIKSMFRKLRLFKVTTIYTCFIIKRYFCEVVKKQNESKSLMNAFYDINSEDGKLNLLRRVKGTPCIILNKNVS